MITSRITLPLYRSIQLYHSFILMFDLSLWYAVYWNKCCCLLPFTYLFQFGYWSNILDENGFSVFNSGWNYLFSISSNTTKYYHYFSTTSCTKMGRVKRFMLILGRVRLRYFTCGSGWVKKIGPTSNSALNITHLSCQDDNTRSSAVAETAPLHVNESISIPLKLCLYSEK